MEKSLKTIEKIILFISIISIIFGIIILALNFCKNENDLVKIDNLYFIVADNKVVNTSIEPKDILLVEESNLSEYHINNFIAYYSADEEGNIVVKVSQILDGYSDDNQSSYIFMVRGTGADSITISGSDVIGKWNGNKLDQIADIYNFCLSRIGFICITIIPLIILFTFEFFMLIYDYIKNKNSC